MKVILKRLFKAFTISIAIILVGTIVGTGFECMYELLESFCGPTVELVVRIVITVAMVACFAYIMVRDHEQERRKS